MTREEIFEVLKANMRFIIEGARGHEITEQHSMWDFGADSFGIDEVVSRTMKRCHCKIRRVDLAQAENLGDLLDLFEKATEVVAIAV